MLEDLLSPTLVFVLFYAGLMLIGLEFISPGISVPGVAGVLALVAAFIGFGTLPVRIAGVVLLIASVGFFLLEAKYPGISVAAIGAVICLVVGGYLLIDPELTDEPGVSPWAIGPIAVATVVFFVFAIPAGLRAQRGPSSLSLDNIVGAEGIADTDLGPRGIASIAGETWSAESVRGTVRKGERVRVLATERLRVKVEPIDEVVSTDGTTEEQQGGLE